MSQGMFRSMQQALHFAYLIEVMPVSHPSAMGKALERLMRESGVWGHAVSSIDFSGLTPLEIRGQCAMIRAAVQDHLRDLERAVVLARYTGVQAVRADAVRMIVQRVDAMSGVTNNTAVQAVVWGCYLSGALRDSLSYRRIEAETGVDRRTLALAGRRISARLIEAEVAACDKLQPLFVRDELVAA